VNSITGNESQLCAGGAGGEILDSIRFPQKWRKTKSAVLGAQREVARKWRKRHVLLAVQLAEERRAYFVG
jgi:hypothetical protein